MQNMCCFYHYVLLSRTFLSAEAEYNPLAAHALYTHVALLSRCLVYTWLYLTIVNVAVPLTYRHKGTEKKNNANLQRNY